MLSHGRQVSPVVFLAPANFEAFIYSTSESRLADSFVLLALVNDEASRAQKFLRLGNGEGAVDELGFGILPDEFSEEFFRKPPLS